MTTKINQYHPQIAYHPGETLAEKLEELGMKPKEFAVCTGQPEETVMAIVKGKSSVTPEIAERFEKALKIPVHFWLNTQRSYDEFLVRKKHLSQAAEWAKKFPYPDMVKKGWVTAQTGLEGKTSELFTFFGISSYRDWEKSYFNQQFKVAFRLSQAHTKELYAISAWLRKGELQARELSDKAYNEKKFKEVLPEIKSILAKHPKDLYKQLQKLCLAAGVKVVHTPFIKKAPIDGGTHWINDTPLIQLTGRHNRNDSFWFTFFHEAGHILLHGKKDIFLESIDYSDKDKKKEIEANDFAKKWLLSEDEEKEILKHITITKNGGVIDKDDVIKLAKKFNTHPAIIIGRLHHTKALSYKLGRQFLEPVEFE